MANENGVIGVEIVATDKTAAGFESAERRVTQSAKSIASAADKVGRKVPEQFSRATAAMTPMLGTIGKFDNSVGRAAYGLVQLGSVVAGGGILGIGIAAFTASVSAASAVMAVYEQRAKSVTDAMTSINKALAAQSAEARATGGTLAQLEERLRTFGMTANEVAREAIGAQLMSREGFGDRYAAEIKKLEEANERLRASMTRVPHRRGSGAGAALAEIEAAKEQIKLNDMAIEGLKKGIELAKSNNEEDKKKLATLNQIMDLEAKQKLGDAKKKQGTSEAERTAREAAAIEAKWTKVGLDEQQRLRLEAAEDLKRISSTNASARIAIEQGLAWRLEEIEDAHNQRMNEKKKRETDKLIDGILARRLRMIDLIADAEEAAAIKQDALEQQRKARMENMAADIVGVWGDAFASMVTDSKNASKTILISLIRTARAAVMAYAAQSAAGGASSQSGIPIVGPALAVVAAGSLFAFVEAMVSRIPSAAGGFDIPAGMNPIIQAHSKEMVLPEHIANPLRESLAGGGFGSSITLNVNAMDGESIKRVAQDPEFWRGVREAERNGRGGFR